jgi:Ni,Fe-hydrogenase I cytochrome b subunit
MGVFINGVTQNVWFIMEDPIEMDELGVPPLQETAIYIYIYICMYIIRAGVKTYENYHMTGGVSPF